MIEDKAVISGFYDEHGMCHMIEIRLNAPGVSREDVAEAVRAVAQPGALAVPRSVGEANSYPSRELGSTEVIPAVFTNGNTVASPRQRGVSVVGGHPQRH